VIAAALHRALTDPDLRPLPPEAERLLVALDAPPRLAAHLRAVHDAATELVAWVGNYCPTVDIDQDAVLFGAATHDIGKIRHPEELSGPGHAHEPAGYALLIEQGVPEKLARFARTHAAWTEPDIGINDLLVSCADKVWKAKRVPDLEQLLVDRLAAANRSEPWQAFLDLDDEFTRIAADADRKLDFQNSHPVAA
jgi:hypothetical protein